MKVLQQTNGGLLAARIHLTAPDKASFTLIAMSHVAEQSFYNLVSKDLDEHDAVLCEGAPGRSLTAVFQRALAIKGRVAQCDALPWKGQPHWYSADMSPAVLTRRLLCALSWRVVPISLVLVLVMLVGRTRWFHSVANDDEAKDPEDKQPGDGIEDAIGMAAKRVLLDERDAILAGHCASMMDGWAGRRIAVPWGAGHIPQLARFLIEDFGYEIVDTRWQRIHA